MNDCVKNVLAQSLPQGIDGRVVETDDGDGIADRVRGFGHDVSVGKFDEGPGNLHGKELGNR